MFNPTNSSNYTLYGFASDSSALENTAAVYQLEAFFSGDTTQNHTLYGTAPNSSQYALCTALWYFGYEL